MNKKLLEKYREYASTEESLAVLFVKKHLREAKGYWVDPLDWKRYEMSLNTLHFRFVRGGLFKRKIRPKYPPKSKYTINGKFDDRTYYLMVRAITWEAAHKDIEQQKSRNIRPRKFKLTGVSYDKNRNNKNFFRKDTPPEIKALAKNINDRTDRLWDRALQYRVKPEFVYKIRSIYLEAD